MRLRASARPMPACAATCSPATRRATSSGDVNPPQAWYAGLYCLESENASPPRSRTMRRAAAAAIRSPSKAKGTPLSDGRTFLTKVIRGCTEATPAPFAFKAASSRLLKAPLQWSAIFPRQLALLARLCAAAEISRSGMHSHTSSDFKAAVRMLQTGGPPRRRPERSAATLRARAREPASFRATISSMVYPAFRSDSARAVPRFPGPTMVTLGLAAILRRISKPAFTLGSLHFCPEKEQQVLRFAQDDKFGCDVAS